MKIINTAITVSACLCAMVLGQCEGRGQNIFVGSVGASSLYELSGGTQTTFSSGLNSPSGLAFDASGDLFEGDESGNVYEWVGGGTTRSTFASGVSAPNYMAIDKAGDVFVNANGTAIDEFNPAGTLINTITGISSKGLAGLAFDTAGNLYISSINGGAQGAGFIAKITPNGVESTFASGLNYPVGLAFDAVGDLFVSNGNQNNTITEITPTGSQSTFASGLNNPADIEFDKSGDLYVADIGHSGGDGDITEITAKGDTVVISSSVGAPATLAIQGVILPIPEPSTYAFLGLGLAAFLVCFNKRTQAA